MIKRILVAFVALFTFSAGVVAFDTVPVAQAQLTNCSKWTSGRYGYGSCSGSTANPPYTTQVVVVVTCDKWDWLPNGGDEYDVPGQWVGKNGTSKATCAQYYNAKNPRLLFK